MQIAVVGGGVCSPEACETAQRLGWILAGRAISSSLEARRGDGGGLPGGP